jgi:hypothetical protein
MTRICALKRDAINQAKPASKFRSFSVFPLVLFSRPEYASAGTGGGPTIADKERTETAENMDEQALLALVVTKQEQILGRRGALV